MELKQWVIEYVKARDAMLRTIKETKDSGDEITYTHKNKVQHYLISPKLQVPQARDFYIVACLNTEENLQFLVQHWQEFLQDRLTIQFINPNTGAFWKVNTKLHSSVADPSNLENGLRALFSEVPTV